VRQRRSVVQVGPEPVLDPDDADDSGDGSDKDRDEGMRLTDTP
jgi:hypothetical protein